MTCPSRSDLRSVDSSMSNRPVHVISIFFFFRRRRTATGTGMNDSEEPDRPRVRWIYLPTVGQSRRDPNHCEGACTDWTGRGTGGLQTYFSCCSPRHPSPSTVHTHHALLVLHTNITWLASSHRLAYHIKFDDLFLNKLLQMNHASTSSFT